MESDPKCSGFAPALMFGIEFGGAFPPAEESRWTLEAGNQTEWNARGRTHRFKALLWGRIDGLSQDGFPNGLGTFTFNSIEDFAASRASSNCVFWAWSRCSTRRDPRSLMRSADVASRGSGSSSSPAITDSSPPIARFAKTAISVGPLMSVLNVRGTCQLIHGRRANPAGGVTRYEYDASHRLTRITDSGSNLIVADEGFPGTVVHVLTTGVERDGNSFTVTNAGSLTRFFRGLYILPIVTSPVAAAAAVANKQHRQLHQWL